MRKSTTTEITCGARHNSSRCAFYATQHQKEYCTLQVCGITDEELLRRIHQTYRAQYILDVVLPAPSIFEENLFNSLNHFIYLQRSDIVHTVVVCAFFRFVGVSFRHMFTCSMKAIF